MAEEERGEGEGDRGLVKPKPRRWESPEQTAPVAAAGRTATMLVRLCEQARSGQARRQMVAGMAKRQAAEMQSPRLLARSRVTGPPQGGPFLKRHFHLQLKRGLGGPERKGSEDEKTRVHRLKTSDK